MDGRRTRREFLRLAAGAAAVAAGASCGSDKPKPSSAARAGGERTLRIAQWSHYLPAYDRWFDDEYTRRWGEEHGVRVLVDHIRLEELPGRADAEVTAQGGHDVFGFIFPPPAFEDQVIDHREIVEEVEAKLGKMTPLVERGVLNRRTGKYFGFGAFWAPSPVHYRVDLWDGVQPGLHPDTWEDVLRAGARLKAAGHPLGIGFGPEDLDANISQLALMHAFGSSIQDEEAKVTINSRQTVEAVKLGVAIFKAGMTDEVFAWNGASNNRFLATGKGSLIFNPISAVRAVEEQDPALARQIALAPFPAGPVQRLGPHYVAGIYVIWKFSRNKEVAKQFLVDLAVNSREAFVRSQLYNLPAFPAAVGDLGQLVAGDARAQPPEKYALLAEAAQWSTNVGHPGHMNSGVAEVFDQVLIPKMFAAAARGEMSAEEAVRAAGGQIEAIFEKWRERGMV
ncbi:MAG: ABC transporter substrate-binding protein [Acidimicrobiia bacterium]